VAAVVLLGLPFIVLIGMAGLVIAAGFGLLPGADGLSGDTSWVLLLFFVIWGVVASLAVLMFVVRLLRRSSQERPH
jgi:hypothetical protein